MRPVTLEIARRTNSVLRQYMNIQNDLFKPSLRKLIRLPGIYTPVDYQGNRLALTAISVELEDIKRSIRDFRPDNESEDGKFLILQRAYVSGMARAVSCVKLITEKLYQRSMGNKEYSKKDYGEDIEVFKKVELEFLEIGLKLNKIIHEKQQSR